MRSHPSFVVFFFERQISRTFLHIQNLAYFFSNLADLEVRETLFPRHWYKCEKKTNRQFFVISKVRILTTLKTKNTF